MIANIFQANADTADIMFLLAMILFVVASVISFTRSAVVEGLAWAGAAFLAVAWMFLT